MATADKATILLVEDEQDIRTIARLSLQHLGSYNVIEASSGAQALELAGHPPLPAAIVLDVMMPGMDGIDVFRALKANSSTRDLPVIFLTAKAMPAELDRLREMGARAILTKPFDPPALVNLVRHVLETRGHIDPGAMASPVGQSPTIDTDALLSLWGLPGETQADLLGELIELFAAQTPEVLDRIRVLAGTSVAREVERLAHSLKSSALTLGVTAIADLARTMETMAGDGRVSDVGPLVDRIDALLAPAIGRLRVGRARLLSGVEPSV